MVVSKLILPDSERHYIGVGSRVGWCRVSHLARISVSLGLKLTGFKFLSGILTHLAYIANG